MQTDNIPKWDKQKNGFYEVWYLKLNIAPNKPALWLRFTTLSSKNGLKKIAETWAIFFDPENSDQATQAGSIKKIAIKSTANLGAYSTKNDGTISIEDSILGPNFTKGCVVSRGNKIEWDLSFTPNDFTFFHVPQIFEKLKLSKSTVCKPNINIHFTGTFSVNGKKYECHSSPGCSGHIWGTKYAHSWSWAHCNLFENNPDCVLEILSARIKLGDLIASPQMSALFFQYKGEQLQLNKFTDLFTIQSKAGLTNWDFAAEHKNFRISGNIKCSLNELTTITYEDTDGSYLYCKNTELAQLTLGIYYKGKLDSTLISKGCTGFETVSRERSPYVEIAL